MVRIQASQAVPALLLVLLFVTTAPGAAAQAVDCANAASQASLNACADRGARKADAALDRAYAEVMSRLEPAGKARLRDAQRAWLAFRDKECAFESSGADGGSVAPMVALNCFAALTDQRIRALAGFRVCTEGDVSCPR